MAALSSAGMMRATVCLSIFQSSSWHYTVQLQPSIHGCYTLC